MTFNPNDFKDEYELLPKGKYVMAVAKAEWKDAKKNDIPTGGKFMSLQYVVQEGECADRAIFERLNLIVPPDATDGQKTGQHIAQTTLANLCRALNVAGLENGADGLIDPTPLIGPFFIGDVDVKEGGKKPDGSSYPDQNKVKKYLPKTSVAPVATGRSVFGKKSPPPFDDSAKF